MMQSMIYQFVMKYLKKLEAKKQMAVIMILTKKLNPGIKK
jgi:hypothetical protein